MLVKLAPIGKPVIEINWPEWFPIGEFVEHEDITYEVVSIVSHLDGFYPGTSKLYKVVDPYIGMVVKEMS